MQVTSAMVVFAVLWFLVLFCVLPFRNLSQGEAGEVVKGTTASAPANPQMKKRFLITTLIAIAIWIPVVLGVIYGFLTVENFNLYKIIGPDA
ncbi:MAG: DUF1467 family protein [Litoreibacter sp.]